MELTIQNAHHQMLRIGGLHCAPGDRVTVDMDLERAQACEKAGYYRILTDIPTPPPKKAKPASKPAARKTTKKKTVKKKAAPKIKSSLAEALS